METTFRVLSGLAGLAVVLLAGYGFVLDARPLAAGETRISRRQLDRTFVIVLVVLVISLAVVMRLAL